MSSQQKKNVARNGKVKMVRKTSVLTAGIVADIEAIRRDQRLSFSDVARLALQMGLPILRKQLQNEERVE